MTGTHAAIVRSRLIMRAGLWAALGLVFVSEIAAATLGVALIDGIDQTAVAAGDAAGTLGNGWGG